MPNQAPLVQTYAFDPTGQLAANKIVNEQQIITGINWRDFHFIVPRLAPFFEDSVKIRFVDPQGNPRYLIKDVDWYPTHKFMDASLACAKPICGSISFLNAALTGTVIVEYQTVGGNWVLDDQAVAEILADRLHNPRRTTWEEVTNRPIDFPVIDHEWNLIDMVGMSDVTAVLGRIEDELRKKGEGGLTDHVNNVNNPHKTNKDHIGLGKVSNFATANDADAVAGSANDLFMTPFQTKRAIAAQVGNLFAAHAENTGNPHGTTAAQVGAFSKLESTTQLAQKLDKTATAYDTDRIGGMTIAEFKQYALDGVASDSVLFSGMTFSQLKLAIQGGASADAERFDGKTFDEATAVILSGTAASAAKFGGKTATEYLNYVLASTIANSTRLNNRTDVETKNWILSFEASSAATFGGLDADSYRASVLNGKASDSFKLEGNNLSDVIAAARNGEALSARNFGGMDSVAYRQNVLSGTIANSTRFGTYTVPEFITYLQTSGAVGGGSEFITNWSVQPLPGNNLDNKLNATGIYEIKPTDLLGTLPEDKDGKGILFVLSAEKDIYQQYFNTDTTNPQRWARAFNKTTDQWGAWVSDQSGGGNIKRAMLKFTVPVTLVKNDFSSFGIFKANVGVTLPPVNTVDAGKSFKFVGGNTGGNIVAAGTDKIVTPQDTLISTQPVAVNTIVEVTASATEWLVTQYSDVGLRNEVEAGLTSLANTINTTVVGTIN